MFVLRFAVYARSNMTDIFMSVSSCVAYTVVSYRQPRRSMRDCLAMVECTFYLGESRLAYLRGFLPYVMNDHILGQDLTPQLQVDGLWRASMVWIYGATLTPF